MTTHNRAIMANPVKQTPSPSGRLVHYHPGTQDWPLGTRLRDPYLSLIENYVTIEFIKAPTKGNWLP